MDATNLLAKAAECAPALRGQSDTNDRLGKLGDITEAVIRKGGFLGLLGPRCFGGAEAKPTEAIRVVEVLTQADASTGWVVMANGLCVAAAGAYLGDDAAEHLLGGGRQPLIAGHGGANGIAAVDGKGFRLTGHWRYGSGVLNADYIHSGAVIHENGAPRLTAAGHPEIRIFVTPRDSIVPQGNWDVLGLKATGSVDYTMKDVFVGEEFSHLYSVTEPKRGGSLYTIGLLGFAVIGHTAFALGVGRRALDEVAAYARGHSGPTGPLGASHVFHQDYGVAEARFRAGRALVYEVWGDIEQTIARGDRMNTRQITLARLAMSHVTEVAADVATFAYRAGGGAALRESALQRCFRDIHAGTQHLHASPVILRECGRELAGLAAEETWGRFGLSRGTPAVR
jgi:indole-3-acetate monooxygenase